MNYEIYYLITHALGGHLGQDKTLEKVSQRFYWKPNMTGDLFLLVMSARGLTTSLLSHLLHSIQFLWSLNYGSRYLCINFVYRDCNSHSVVTNSIVLVVPYRLRGICVLFYAHI